MTDDAQLAVGGEVVVDGTMTPVPIPGHPEQSVPSSRLVVSFDEPTGAVHGGATGMLYGLSDPGVPARQLVSGIRPRTVAQKAPGGLQHPNGDALEVAADFFAAGGEEILVYIQDHFAEWPYEFLGIDDYVERVEAQVRAVLAANTNGIFTWVPFNEPDWIWYRDWPQDRERFFADWLRVHSAIRTLDPSARIVGPNEMEYRPARLRDFLTWARDHDVLPDVMSWHELAPESLATYRSHHADYRALERELGIGPLPINIDEYGNRRDMSDPGQLIQWMAMFEATKVDADLAYWTMAGNLDDHAVQTTGANGGWWLLAWYSRLRGSTVRVTPPFPNIPDTLQAIATIDAERRSATVLLGGSTGEIVVAIEGLDALDLADGQSVRIEIESTTWSGQEGFAPPPRLLSSAVVAWAAPIELRIPGGDRMAAYRINVAPEARPEWPLVAEPWRASYEAEHASVVGGVIAIHDDDAQKYGASGGRDVRGLVLPSSAVTFTVDIPESGDYDLAIHYGTPGVRSRQALVVDGIQLGELDYPATLSLDYRARLVRRLTFTEGTHTVSFRASDALGHLPASDVSLDRIDLVRATPLEMMTVPVRDARLDGSTRIERSSAGFEYAVLEAGTTARYWISADEHGYYAIEITVDGSESDRASLQLGEAMLTESEGITPRGRVQAVVFLSQGITELVVGAVSGTVSVGAVHLERNQAGDVNSAPITDGERPASIGPGLAVLTVSYANGAKEVAENYNTDVVTLFASVEEEGGTHRVAAFRHSYDWSNFWRIGVLVDLETESGAIRVIPHGEPAPAVSSMTLSPLVLSLAVEESL